MPILFHLLLAILAISLNFINKFPMSTIKAFIRVSQKRKNNIDVAVRFRLSDGRSVQLFYKSEIYVDPEVWDQKRECIKAKVLYSTADRNAFDNSISDMKKLMRAVYDAAPNRGELTSDDFTLLMDKRLHPDRYGVTGQEDDKDFFKQFDRFLGVRDLATSSRKQYMVTYRCLKRFEQFKALSSGKAYKMGLDALDADFVGEFESFLKNEHLHYKKQPYKQLYDDSESRPPVKRGWNTICNILKKFRAFTHWAMVEGLTRNDPFLRYTIKAQKYGTPYYITIEERDKIAHADLLALWECASDEVKQRICKTHIPQLEVQRDIFVFQCLVGCRVGDLNSLTPSKVIKGSIQYIAGKTKGEHPNTIIVPLNSTAKAILAKYYDGKRTEGKLFPFIADQRYNEAIKDIFTLVGITRKVTILNPATNTEIQRPINEVASSHLARRTFIGNLYKKVKDPNLIGKLSGHAEGSRAFARYRDIDDDMKRDLVNLLENDQ